MHRQLTHAKDTNLITSSACKYNYVVNILKKNIKIGGRKEKEEEEEEQQGDWLHRVLKK